MEEKLGRRDGRPHLIWRGLSGGVLAEQAAVLAQVLLVHGVVRYEPAEGVSRSVRYQGLVHVSVAPRSAHDVRLLEVGDRGATTADAL
eukprot:16331176-Heterocapsa_arctica.AAC.1